MRHLVALDTASSLATPPPPPPTTIATTTTPTTRTHFLAMSEVMSNLINYELIASVCVSFAKVRWRKLEQRKHRDTLVPPAPVGQGHSSGLRDAKGDAMRRLRSAYEPARRAEVREGEREGEAEAEAEGEGLGRWR